jgi:hypothetical protein
MKQAFSALKRACIQARRQSMQMARTSHWRAGNSTGQLACEVDGHFAGEGKEKKTVRRRVVFILVKVTNE